MQRFTLLVASLTAMPALVLAGDNHRELGAHEHGSGALNVAIEGTQLVIELEVPGADIVGFEYTAKTDADRAAVETAIADLAKPLDLFLVPGEAGCTVTEAKVSLVGEDHGAHDADAHDHDHSSHDDHEHDEHGHGEHDHDEASHDDAEASAEHNEFHARYMFDCTTPEAIDRIEFAYFARFPNALELEVQTVSGAGAQVFDIERDTPVLDLRGVF
ncbi:MAG: DUF2796 domain-containing protein [Pseudomonadota bacterium]